MAQEQGGLFGLNIILKQLAVEGAMKAPRADRDARDCGDTVVAIAVTQNRCLTDRAPGLPDGWDQEKSAFIDEDDMGRQPCGVFFTAGQTVRFHCSMSASFRSSARRSGF